jgi:hypothetical protein
MTRVLRAPSGGRRSHRLADRLREHEAHVLLDHFQLLDDLGPARAEERDEPLHELLGCARAARDADDAAVLQPGFLDLALVVDQVGVGAELARDIDEPVRVRRVLRADHEHEVARPRELLDGRLAVRRGVTDVVGARPDDRGKLLAQLVDDRARLIDRQGRLRDVGDACRVLDLEAVDVVLGLDQDDVVGRLPHRALDLLVAFVADEHDRVALGGESLRLDVNLRDERTCRVDRAQSARERVRVDAWGDPMRREDDGRALRHLGLLVDEDRPARAQLLDDVLVVHDLLAHVHGCAVQVERPLDRLHGPVDAGAVAARLGEQQLLGCVRHGLATV